MNPVGLQCEVSDVDLFDQRPSCTGRRETLLFTESAGQAKFNVDEAFRWYITTMLGESARTRRLQISNGRKLPQMNIISLADSALEIPGESIGTTAEISWARAAQSDTSSFRRRSGITFKPVEQLLKGAFH
jgi:hypothetical protein